MSFKIGKHIVGVGDRVYIIAEMSGNHGGDINKAKEIIRAAKEVGADAVKLQTYRPDTITLDCDNPDFRIPSTNPWSEHQNLYQLYEKAFTPWEWHGELFALAKEIGLDIFSSPFDESAVEFLEKLDAPAYKIASPEITHIPLLKKVAQTGKPVIVSTGVAELEDIEMALKTLRGAGTEQIVLLKCTSSYPAPPESINLRMIHEFSQRFKCIAGLSDHTLGIGIPVASVAIGARVIEKHFILEKTDSSVDGFFSLDKTEFKQMVDEIRKVEKALGYVSYDLDPEGMKNKWGRRSIYVSSDVGVGDVISSQNIKVVRPANGLHPMHYDQVIGKKFNKKLKKGDRLSFDDID